MRSGALRRSEDQQLDLYERPQERNLPEPRDRRRSNRRRVPLCRSCRASEARYGFVDDDSLERPRTLCFECFRSEMERRQEHTRIRRAAQIELPIAQRLNQLDLRRRRAMIAARRAIGLLDSEQL